jgi:hypothetical protein
MWPSIRGSILSDALIVLDDLDRVIWKELCNGENGQSTEPAIKAGSRASGCKPLWAEEALFIANKKWVDNEWKWDSCVLMYLCAYSQTSMLEALITGLFQTRS